MKFFHFFIHFKFKLTLLTMTAAMFLMAMPLSATTRKPVGGVDYSWGVDGLSAMTRFVTTMMTLTMGITFAIAGTVSIIGALNIYIKMSTGQEGVTKSIMMLIGAVIFMIGATMVMPAFFGWSYNGAGFNY